MSERQRIRLQISGAVQGVGFRPFVYRLASELGLAGFVNNSGGGVTLEVEGEAERVSEFARRLPREVPAAALITKTHREELVAGDWRGFEIRPSDEAGSPSALLLPDLATCDACRHEALSADDRRAGYPFTNCTDCGPRFSIINSLPYDRPRTTMSGFTMCPDCGAEYHDPLDRRFHAQPTACPDCGPQIALQSPAGETLETGAGALAQAAAALSAGQVLALKGLGGFQLLVDASSEEAVARLRRRKARPTKPLAIMVADLDQATSLVEIEATARALLTSPQAPIVLLPRRADAAGAAAIAPGLNQLGLLLPSTPLHHLLLRAFGAPVVATSGNRSGEPLCTDNAEALDRLAGIADLFLVHDRPIARHVDDSVACVVDDAPRLLRRARGYAPLPVAAQRPLPTLLAVGAQQKAAVALSLGDQIFVGQHIGDLDSLIAQQALERCAADLLEIYRATPVAVVHDRHPGYASTRWAQRITETAAVEPPLRALAGLPRLAVQHHHAHLAACLAEHPAVDSALGAIWDGSGDGGDGTVWGGEFLLGNAAAVKRVAALRPFRLLGGEAAIRDPQRLALALRWQLHGAETLDDPEMATRWAGQEQVLVEMLRRGVQSPLTSSAGRLFDGVTALCGLAPEVSYEGEAAMRLEAAVDPSVREAYPLPLLDVAAEANTQTQAAAGVPAATRPRLELDWRPLVEAVLQDLAARRGQGLIAARFHNALAAAIVAVAERVDAPRIALSGGCFQNRILLQRSVDGLRARGLEVLLHRQVPANDGGICLGQVAVAAAALEGGGDLGSDEVGTCAT